MYNNHLHEMAKKNLSLKIIKYMHKYMLILYSLSCTTNTEKISNEEALDFKYFVSTIATNGQEKMNF